MRRDRPLRIPVIGVVTLLAARAIDQRQARLH
jgi:hypothetical protein